MADIAACPHCGAEIAADAHFCHHCGSSDEDGWKEEADTDVDDFDYDQYVADNFPTSTSHTSVSPFWRIVAIVLLLLFFLGFLFI